MKASVRALVVMAMLYPLAGSRAAMAAEHPATEENGAIVLVFKDGHKQSYPAASIADVEFHAATGAVTRLALPDSFAPGRRRFVGAWVVGDGMGGTFTIQLEENGEASKTRGASHGTWSYVDGEARVSWDDGWHDIIRKTGLKYEKFAYEPGRLLSEKPSNVTEAREKDPSPI